MEAVTRVRAGIALGSNLGDRMAHLRSGREGLAAIQGAGAPAYSSRVYETAPVDAEPGSGAYLNAVVEIEYTGHPIALLDALQQIEAEHGRPSKRPRNAPRTIDLDILYVGNLTLANEEVVIPHPRLHTRAFVLIPLADIRAELILPGQTRSIAEMLASLSAGSSVKLFAETW